MNWTGKHRAFTMETFIKTNKRTRSPDLNPCDFFLWGYLKSKVYSNRPQSIEELKDAFIPLFSIFFSLFSLCIDVICF